MAAGDLTVLGEGIQVQARAITDRYDETTLAALRSHLLGLEAFLRSNPKVGTAEAREELAHALRLVDAAYAFASELQGFLAQKQHTELASLFDLGSIGVLGIENVLTAEKPSLVRVLMAALAEGLVFAASRQYVAGARDLLAVVYRTHAAAMHRELWALATDRRKGMTANDVKEVQANIGVFFRKLEANDVPPETRVRILKEFFVLVLVIRVADLLEALGSAARKPAKS